jgi:molybdenum cofactor cytidylyltransferase
VTTTAVLLAAGLSSRMGGPNKLLLDLGGAPLVRRVAEALAAVTDATPPVAVLGRDAPLVEETLHGLGFRTTRIDPALGQARSMRAGLAAAPEADETLIALADQPLLTPAALAALLAAHRTDPARITVPMNGTARGNPIVLPRALGAAIATDGPNLGCRSFTERFPHLVHGFATDDPAFFTDVDTPEDYAALSERVR